MKPDPEYLRRHYAALSDAALLVVDGDELVEEARAIYLEEVSRRKLAGFEPEPERDEEQGGGIDLSPDDGEKPEWLADAGCACEFADAPGRASGSDAAHARQILLDAGVPCYLDVEENLQNALEYRLMVPGKRIFEAASVLDRELFNPETCAKWKAHFEELSEKEFREVELEMLLAGHLDLVERVKRAYEEEVMRRKRRGAGTTV